MASYADLIAGIESGGRYGVLGPITKSGDRAYGKYQVMGSNIPAWTKQYYGQSLTPEQFVSNPEAQDAVFKGKFENEYVRKYGPEGAARAWFAGEGGMNDMNRKDILGTTVASYGQKFANAMNQQPLVPGTQAPPLPPPVSVQSLSTSQPTFSGVPSAQSVSALPALAAYSWSPQKQEQMSAPPPMPDNPIVAMAMSQPPPDTRSIYRLLQRAPAPRGFFI